MRYKIRSLKSEEQGLLELFLYEAIYQRPGVPLLPKDVIKQPELMVYIKDFGKASDHCLVAEYKERVIGAVWTRILSNGPKGFGNIDDQTPEFALSILKDFRGKGIGTSSMKEMLLLLKQLGYSQASLAVQKDNYALGLYQKVGFTIIDENEEEYILIQSLT